MESAFDFNERPYMVVWEVTRACALVCQHCRAKAQAQADPKELNTDEGILLLEQIERAKPQLLVFSGGDPMQRDDIFELIEYAANKKKFRVALSPSATPKLLKTDFGRLKKIGVDGMSLSLDGADQDSHNKFRGVKRSWDWTMEAVEKAKEAEIGLQINTTITRGNVSQLEDFLPLLEKIQPTVWSIFLLIPTGRGKKEDSLDAQEMEDLFLQLYKISSRVSYRIKTTEGQHYRRILIQHGKAEKILGLNDGKGFIFVSHTGEVCPSGFLPLAVDNVRHSELIDVYRDTSLFKELRSPNLLKGKCGKCEYNSICGGSRARAYAITGDYLAEEPCCVYKS